MAGSGPFQGQEAYHPSPGRSKVPTNKLFLQAWSTGGLDAGGLDDWRDPGGLGQEGLEASRMGRLAGGWKGDWIN